MSGLLIILAAPGPKPLAHEAALVAEFETLLLQLDDHSITRPGWDRFVGILAQATLEAGDAEAGRDGYVRALAQWRVSRWYDGHD
jgi:hypothetical protein